MSNDSFDIGAPGVGIDPVPFRSSGPPDEIVSLKARLSVLEARQGADARAWREAVTVERLDNLERLLDRTDRTWSPESTAGMRQSGRALLTDLRALVSAGDAAAGKGGAAK